MFYSPDGSRMAIMDDWGSTAILDVATGKTDDFDEFLTQVSHFFNWFPDNPQILARDNGDNLRLVNPVNGERILLAVVDYGIIDGAAASPDGYKVVYSHGNDSNKPSEIRFVSADGRDSTLVFETSARPYSFSWSPDGKTIIFLEGGYVAMNADGSNLRSLDADPPAQCTIEYPLWSPDSSTLAVVVTSDPPGAFCQGWSEKVFKGTNIYLIDVESGKSRPLLPDGSTGNIDPAWSPDGSQIAFISNRSGTSEAWVVNADGSGLRQMTKEGRYLRFPVWRRP